MSSQQLDPADIPVEFTVGECLTPAQREYLIEQWGAWSWEADGTLKVDWLLALGPKRHEAQMARIRRQVLENRARLKQLRRVGDALEGDGARLNRYDRGPVRPSRPLRRCARPRARRELRIQSRPKRGVMSSGGAERIRTAVRGFAGPCLTTRPPRPARFHGIRGLFCEPGT